MKEVKISNIQLGLITMAFLYGSSAVVNPVMIAKRDAWIALIIGWMIGFLLTTMYLFISKMNNYKTLSDILKDCFGKVLGKTITVLYILYFIYEATINTRVFGEFMVTVSYPETPLIVLTGCLILTVVYAVRSDLKVMGRVSEILVPLIPVPIFIVSTSVITMHNYTGFQPVLMEIAPVIKGVLTMVSSVFGDYVIFLMVFPYLNNKVGMFKASYFGLAAIGTLLMIITVRNLKVIGPALFEYFSYPSHVAAQLIPGINIDPLVDINLLLGGGLKVSICLYAAVKATAELFKIEDYRPLVSAFAVLIIVLSFWIAPNAIELKRWSVGVGSVGLTFPFQIMFPLLILFITFIKNRKKSLG